MIQNITRGSSPEGALAYVHNNESAQRVAGSMASQSPKGMAREWEAYRKRNPRVEKDVWHSSLSVHPDDELTDEECFDIANEYVEKMGFEDSPWVAYRHDDTDHTHIHIVASRVQFDGQSVDVWRDYTRGEQVCRELEDKYELTKAPPSQTRDRKAPTREEYELQKRTGEKSIKEDLGDRVEAAAWASDTMEEFADELAERDVAMKMHRHDDGEPYGVEYVRQSDGERMKGSDLGRAFGWGGLQKRAEIDYEHERGDARLERSNERAEEAIADNRRGSGDTQRQSAVPESKSANHQTGHRKDRGQRQPEGDAPDASGSGQQDPGVRRAERRDDAGREGSAVRNGEDAESNRRRIRRSETIERRSRGDSSSDREEQADHRQDRSDRDLQHGDTVESDHAGRSVLSDGVDGDGASEHTSNPRAPEREDEREAGEAGEDLSDTRDMSVDKLEWKKSRRYQLESDGKTYAAGDLQQGELTARERFRGKETLLIETDDQFDFAEVELSESDQLEVGDTVKVMRVAETVKVKGVDQQQERGLEGPSL